MPTTTPPPTATARRIVMYAFAIETIGQIIDSLYGLTLFTYIGTIIGIIYFIIAVRNINPLDKIDNDEM